MSTYYPSIHHQMSLKARNILLYKHIIITTILLFIKVLTKISFIEFCGFAYSDYSYTVFLFLYCIAV